MPPSIPPGTRLGAFEILALLGSGGMGDVYRARDTVLKREVALKVLPEAVAQDHERVARFTREAEVLASLNHPHIAQIYGMAEGDGVHAIVMELVEGEDLARRLTRSAIPLAEALPMARQIAEALEAAHEHGVVHRDLKPANITLRTDGTVKVLDFGLAKPAAPTPESLANSPTVTTPAATRAGVILGTAAYMSPEQARGKPVDRRADIWAFGCVLFEMLTGRPAFAGETVTDVLAAVVDKEPEWRVLPSATPTAIRRLLQRCLAKDVQRRLPHIGAARLELDEPTAQGEMSAVDAPPRGPVGRWRLAAATLSLAGAAVVGYTLNRPPEALPAAAQRVAVLLPPGVRLTETSNFLARSGHELAVSADARLIVFAGSTATGSQLYARRLSEYEARPLPGTEDATVPVISPDGAWVSFQANGQLRKVSLIESGGIPQVISALPGPITAAAWGTDGDIIFASRSGLSRVAATGGTPVTLTTLLPGEDAHDSPSLLPSGDVLFELITSPQGQQRSFEIAVFSKKTGERRTVVRDALGVKYVSSGRLVFFRAGGLWTVPFDESTGTVAGTAVQIVDDVFAGGSASRSFDTSAHALMYVPGGRDRDLLWVERDGRTSPLLRERGGYEHPTVSPDGTRVAFDVGLTATRDLWVLDVRRGTRARLTTATGVNATAPIWTPDGTAVAYQCNNDLCKVSADGGGQPESLLRRDYSQTPTSWSPDGRFLLYLEQHPKTARDIWVWQADREPVPVLTTPYNESGAVFSPDGRYLAYVSDESGRLETYVRRFQGGTERWLVSTNGGAEPLWSADGKELFYREDDAMMAVPVTLQPTFTAGVPHRLFEGRFDRNDGHQHYSVSGNRFVKVQRDQDVGPGRLHMILNFAEELKAGASGGRRAP